MGTQWMAGTVCMATNVDTLALNAWEQMWNVYGNIHGMAGALSIGTSVELLYIFAWEQVQNSWRCMYGNICEMAGTTCGNKCGVEGNIRIGTNVE
jgi:hypothetical protein